VAASPPFCDLANSESGRGGCARCRRRGGGGGPRAPSRGGLRAGGGGGGGGGGVTRHRSGGVLATRGGGSARCSPRSARGAIRSATAHPRPTSDAPVPPPTHPSSSPTPSTALYVQHPLTTHSRLSIPRGTCAGRAAAAAIGGTATVRAWTPPTAAREAASPSWVLDAWPSSPAPRQARH